MRINLVLIAIFLFSYSVFSQDKNPLNITGVVLEAENLEPIPFTTVLVDNGKRGTVADNTGYFSFLAYPGDTITFRSVGFRTSNFIIPELLDGDTYSLIEMLVRDNILLDEVVVFPLPDIDYFTRTIVKKDLTELQQQRLFEFKRDLNQLLKQQYEVDSPYYDQWRYAKLYDMTGLVPPNNFLNPMTWSNFIRDWKENNK